MHQIKLVNGGVLNVITVFSFMFILLLACCCSLLDAVTMCGSVQTQHQAFTEEDVTCRQRRCKLLSSSCCVSRTARNRGRDFSVILFPTQTSTALMLTKRLTSFTLFFTLKEAPSNCASCTKQTDK